MNGWAKKLEYSLAKQQEFDKELLKSHLSKCVSVEKADTDLDRKGIDYIATIDGGAKVFIDAKTRTSGCSKFWKDGEPELALETWSVVEDRKVGWTLDGRKLTDYVLYTFPKEDCDRYFFLPFQLLKKVFTERGRSWYRKYPVKTQKSYSGSSVWHSECVFVPAKIVLNAITLSMQGAA